MMYELATSAAHSHTQKELKSITREPDRDKAMRKKGEQLVLFCFFVLLIFLPRDFLIDWLASYEYDYEQN